MIGIKTFATFLVPLSFLRALLVLVKRENNMAAKGIATISALAVGIMMMMQLATPGTFTHRVVVFKNQFFDLIF